MLSLARPAVNITNDGQAYSYAASDVMTALTATTRRLLFRYDLLDLNNVFKKHLTTVQTGSVAYSYSASIKRTAKFTVKDDGTINYLSDRIKPYTLLQMPDRNYAQFPLGVFLLSTPPRQTDNALVVTRAIDGYDQLQVLSDWKTTDRYSIASGTNYVTAVTTLLNNAGINNINATATTLTLTSALDYAGGTSYLKIINDLLTQINYKTLWFDADGTAVVEPWVDPNNLPPGFAYVADDASMVLPQVSQSLDLFSVPNEWVGVVAQSNKAELTSTYTNTNANSPTSTVNRGRTIVKYIQNLNAPDQTTLDSIVKKQATTDSQVYQTVTYSTPIMPFHEDYDIVSLSFPALNIDAKHTETDWSFTLAAGAEMKHVIQRVVTV